MLTEHIASLIIKGNGFLLKSALAEIVFILGVTFMTIKVAVPVLKHYRIAKQLEKIATNPKPHWFYGHARFFGTELHERTYNIARMSDHHPTMFNFWRGPFMSALQLFYPPLIQQLVAAGTPKDKLGYGLIRPWLGDGLLTSEGVKWKRHRMLLTPAFHFSILKPYMQVSNQTVRVLIEKWKKKINQPLEISNDVSLMTLDTMVQCAMSTKTNCQSTEGQHPYVKVVCDVARALTSRLRNPHYLIDWIFKLTKEGKIFYSGVESLHKHAEKIISDRRKVLEDSKGRGEGERRMLDFLDILLQAKDEEERGLTDQEVRDEVDTFLFEGHDTTSSGISWALYNLAKYPEFQEKCREEIQSVCRGQEDIEWDDLSRMSYLTLFLKESMRLYPPVVAAGRQLDKPLKLRCDLNEKPEVEVPAGSMVTIHIMALQRNPIVWENPERLQSEADAVCRLVIAYGYVSRQVVFDPERFNKENSARRNPYAYMPFSVGSRNCIGQNFAMNEMKVCLSQILRNFRLIIDETTPTPKMEFRIILQPQNGIYIKLQPLTSL